MLWNIPKPPIDLVQSANGDNVWISLPLYHVGLARPSECLAETSDR